MSKKKVKLIVNPNADLGRAWQAAADLRPIVESFGGADWSGTVFPTHATDLAYQAGLEGYERIIAAGGDGTVHEIVNGLMRLPKDSRPALGVIPLGSGNDFAHLIGVSDNRLEAVRQAFTGAEKRIDIGRIRDASGRVEYFDNTTGIGFDATVTIRSRKLTPLRGFLIYFVAVIQTILLNHEAPRIHIETENGAWEENLLLVVLCNGGREGGGFFISPRARPDDQLLNYVAIRKVSRPMMFRILPEVMKGTHDRFPQVYMGDFTRLALHADRSLTIHTDGEIFAGFGMDVRSIEAEVLPGELTVVV